ncbi:MAG: hypothetical protein ACK5JT_06905 [Hyphomicrobiaceae bacterium]
MPSIPFLFWIFQTGLVRISALATPQDRRIISTNRTRPTLRKITPRVVPNVLTTDTTKGGIKIAAGCRYFTFEEAQEHWRKTRAGTPLGEETFAILEYLRRKAEIKGLLPAQAASGGLK